VTASARKTAMVVWHFSRLYAAISLITASGAFAAAVPYAGRHARQAHACCLTCSYGMVPGAVSSGLCDHCHWFISRCCVVRHGRNRYLGIFYPLHLAAPPTPGFIGLRAQRVKHGVFTLPVQNLLLPAAGRRICHETRDDIYRRALNLMIFSAVLRVYIDVTLCSTSCLSRFTAPAARLFGVPACHCLAAATYLPSSVSHMAGAARFRHCAAAGRTVALDGAACSRRSTVPSCCSPRFVRASNSINIQCCFVAYRLKPPCAMAKWFLLRLAVRVSPLTPAGKELARARHRMVLLRNGAPVLPPAVAAWRHLFIIAAQRMCTPAVRSPAAAARRKKKSRISGPSITEN